MMATITNITNIPAPRVPFTDERTGLISREWYRFLLNLYTLSGGGQNDTSLFDLQVGPPPSEAYVTEVQKQFAALNPHGIDQTTELVELAKRVLALELVPVAPPALPSVGGGGTTVLSTEVTVVVPWPGSLAYSGDVAFAGVTSANKIVMSVAPALDSDENDAEMLSIGAMSALAGSAIATIKMTFNELTYGPIKLNLMAV